MSLLSLPYLYYVYFRSHEEINYNERVAYTFRVPFPRHLIGVIRTWHWQRERGNIRVSIVNLIGKFCINTEFIRWELSRLVYCLAFSMNSVGSECLKKNFNMFIFKILFIFYKEVEVRLIIKTKISYFSPLHNVLKPL